MMNLCLTYEVFPLLGHKSDLAKGSEWPDIRPFIIGILPDMKFSYIRANMSLTFKVCQLLDYKPV